MKKIAISVTFALLTACANTTPENTNNNQANNQNSGTSSTAQPYQVLSQSLENWQNIYEYGDAKLVGDEMHLISSGNWFYLSKKKYKDFILEAQVKLPDVKEYSNSGILFRAQTRVKGDYQVAYGYQAEVDPSPRKWSGGLYDQGRRQWLNPLHDKRSFPDSDFKQNLSPVWTDEKANAYKANDWNQYRIECRGNEIKIFLNGVLTTHVIDTKDTEGYIGIQHHGSHSYKKTGDRTNIIRFKDIRISEL
ncbi:3-keto-disaccharide hydrolase [Catenovulum sediminis]|uniref:DUF1080 domain-containing protein n=1 Tax=Catenovulum sediminis TaxID=1740262 RepID=A0ABV1RC66_9ALTE|nr:DUF1080 domain-containing protein [Catenovulum sediminis]